ncbi:MAG: hypothetical protein CMP36_02025, partial [Rickettsiales bacterium]
MQENKNIYNLNKVTFIGKDLNIYNSLKNLSSHLGSFNINRALYSDQLIKSNEILILDDSLKQFKEKMLILEKNSANLFLLIEK